MMGALSNVLYRRSTLRLLLLLTPPLLWFGVVYLGSLLALLAQSFYTFNDTGYAAEVTSDLTWANYRALLADANVDIVLRTVGMAAAVTIASAGTNKTPVRCSASISTPTGVSTATLSGSAGTSLAVAIPVAAATGDREATINRRLLPSAGFGIRAVAPGSTRGASTAATDAMTSTRDGSTMRRIGSVAAGWTRSPGL